MYSTFLDFPVTEESAAAELFFKKLEELPKMSSLNDKPGDILVYFPDTKQGRQFEFYSHSSCFFMVVTESEASANAIPTSFMFDAEPFDSTHCIVIQKRYRGYNSKSYCYIEKLNPHMFRRIPQERIKEFIEFMEDPSFLSKSFLRPLPLNADSML